MHCMWEGVYGLLSITDIRSIGIISSIIIYDINSFSFGDIYK